MARDGIIRAIGPTRPAWVAVVALLLGAAAANAQDGGTAAGAANGSVIVDLSVLDSLRPAPADASRARGPVRLIPPSSGAASPSETVRLRPPGGASSRPAPPPQAAAPPPPPPELSGGTVPPPPSAETAPAPKKSPAESARTEEPKAAPPPSVAEPPPAPAPAEPPVATAGKKAPETAPPPPVAAPPPSEEPPVATARKEAPKTAPPPPPAAVPPPDQSAALPRVPKAPSTPGFGAGATRAIAYAAGEAKLTDDAQATLQAAIAALKTNPALRVQLKAYAAGDKEGESRARRLSLSRALGVRSFLIKQGVEPTRIDVRALGSNVPEGSPDRVDVSLVAR
jgi:outer membrane protein OmpA-like peptidoglycan-associated protein